MNFIRLGVTLLPILCVCTVAQDLGALKFEEIRGARFTFAGPIGDRVTRNVDEWLLRAPTANPGMLEMFRVRDRSPAPQLVPWAGEFVGKYLLSAIQALRMSDDARLRAEVERVIRELIASQEEDGYLGPFPKKDRLRGNWDLWGHYHCIEALLMWHEQTGDGNTLAAARKAGDLVCNTFLDGKLRAFDAGSHEMNMAIITALGHLHRLTGEARYLAMMREVEKDWERAGDYFRAGLEGRDFYKTKAPRWESLHDLQGLVELYRITGEQKYRDAFENLWRSIAKNDIHNTGAFSSGEQATGNPYAPGAIETCCTIAWTAICIDMLKLTGNPEVVDYLELATFNTSMGAQHPSGRWWTYNTPMDGAREASAHSIVFQARAGAPELNCCSVNGPRALGLLSEWAVMTEGSSLVINTYLPGKYELPLKSGKIAFEITGNYPLGTEAKLTWRTAPSGSLNIKLHNPKSCKAMRIVAKNLTFTPTTGYMEVQQHWKRNDSITIQFEMPLRMEAGAREMTNRVSIYRGPLLLAYDQALNTFDENAVPATNAETLTGARAKVVYDSKNPLSNWIEVTLGSNLRLCDFATAGCRGARYRSWLPGPN
jgi:DUF1680 family protein